MASDKVTNTGGAGLLGSFVILVIGLIVVGWVLGLIFKLVWYVVVLFVVVSLLAAGAGMLSRSLRRPKL